MDSPALATATGDAARRQLVPGQTQPELQGAARAALGPWQLTARIHEGGRLNVFRARPITDEHGPGCYAIKTPAERFTGERLALALLRREARVAREVAHPQLASLLGARLDVAKPYVVLPYLDGLTLRRVLVARHSDAALAPATALWVARQIADALAALHAAGWLHGQVRPEHAIVSPQGHATLIDLTQSRRLESEECIGDFAPHLAPAYAPPEAFLSRGRLTAAGDIYSLGILLFELLTGRLPFAATTCRQWGVCHLRRRPPNVRELRPLVSRDVAELVERMLAKEPLRRPAAAELVDRLAGLEIEELL